MLCPRCGTMVRDGRQKCFQCGTVLYAQQYPQYGGYGHPQQSPQYGGYPQSKPYQQYGGHPQQQQAYPTYQLPPHSYQSAKTSPGIPAALAFVNGMIAIFIAFMYMDLWFVLGLFLFIIAILLFVGGALIGAEIYRGGAILCFIGGVITIPLGIMGIMAGRMAWENSKFTNYGSRSSGGSSRVIEDHVDD